MNKLKPEVKAEWVRRLRSDEYAQGRAYLCQNGKHCCLGVLAEIAADQGVVTKHISSWDGGIGTLVTFDDSDSLPSLKIGAWALEDEERDRHDWFEPDGTWSPSVPYLAGDHDLDLLPSVSLAVLNDVQKLSFTEIADLVEKHL